jgi:N6-L-threonylcarbamoyladenine synthase
MGLGYPGGPKVSKAAENGKDDIVFVKPNDSLGYNFSFSGKKTAVINYIHNLEQKGLTVPVNDICASFQRCAVDELVDKTIKATLESGLDKVVVAGGVSANKLLRQELSTKCAQNGIKCYLPDLKYCTDNAAMIGSSAYFDVLLGKPFADGSLAPKANLEL